MRPKPTQATVSNPDELTDDSPDNDGDDEKKAAFPPALEPIKADGRRFNKPKVLGPVDAIDFERKDMVLFSNGIPMDVNLW